MSTSIVVLARLSYFHGWEAVVPKGGTKAVFSTQVVIKASDTKQIDAINEAIEEAKKEGKAKLEGVKPSKMRMPLYDGEEEFPGDPNYKGMMYLNASNTKQPEIVKRVNGKNQPVLDEEEVYSGCYAYVAVNFFAYNNMGAGVGCSLQHVLKYKDGERLDGRISADKAFEGVNFDGEDGDEDGDTDTKPAPAKEKPAEKKTEKAAPKKEKEKPAKDADEDEDLFA